MQHRTRKPSGFTLIELLIVVVILSTLAAIVVPQFASTGDSAKDAAAKSSVNGIRTALELYRKDNGDYPLANTGNTVTYCNGYGGTAQTDAAGKLFDSLRLYSDGNDVICDEKPDNPKGPYLRASEFPENPLDGSSEVELSPNSTLGLTATDGKKGWKYQPKTGEFIINNTDFDNY